MNRLALLMAGSTLANAYGLTFAKADKAAAKSDPVPEMPAQALPVEPAKERKSIVPGGWKSKGDVLTKFINEQCTGKDGFEWPAFFALMRQNLGGTLTEEQVAKYEGQVVAKQPGAPGRAKMTLRNMLANSVRTNSKVKGLDGTEHEMTLPKPAVSGAAAKAKEQAATAAQEATA